MKRRNLAVIALVVMVLVIGSLVIVLVKVDNQQDTSPRPPYELQIVVTGQRILGESLEITISVRDVAGMNFSLENTQLTYLSFGVPGSLNVTMGSSGDNPWGLVSVWNLTGMNLTTWQHFVLNAVCVYASESNISAFAWMPKPNVTNWSEVPIDGDGHLINYHEFRILGMNWTTLTIAEQVSGSRSTTSTCCGTSTCTCSGSPPGERRFRSSRGV